MMCVRKCAEIFGGCVDGCFFFAYGHSLTFMRVIKSDDVYTPAPDTYLIIPRCATFTLVGMHQFLA